MQLWDSRFSTKMNPYAWVYNESLSFDHRMALEDINNSVAWATALLTAGVLSEDEYGLVVQALTGIYGEMETGQFVYKPGDEDIHTAVERRLTELIGPLGGKLHTGRSRNDQVAADMRVWLANRIPTLKALVYDLQTCLFNKAKEWNEIILPGYTHMQRAQPVLLGHQVMAFFWQLQRDKDRLNECLVHTKVSPLGSAALAGSAYPIDRHLVASVMGFEDIHQNSIDGISDRDFMVEFTLAVTLVAMHLSKLSEMVVLYSSSEFGFLIQSDAFATGSSIMPQKKNPDIFELTRGKVAAAVAQLNGILMLLKGLPSTYDKDLQEDKKFMFAAHDLLADTLPAVTAAFDELTASEKAAAAALDSSMTATDLADYLVKKGIPFRQAHHIVGKAVKLAADKNIALDGLSLSEWKMLYPEASQEMLVCLDPVYSINQRIAVGGTGKKAFAAQLKTAKEALKEV